MVCHYHSLWDTCESLFLTLSKVDFIMPKLEIRTTLQPVPKVSYIYIKEKGWEGGELRKTVVQFLSANTMSQMD